MTAASPLVSIGLAVYNGEPGLARAIESLLAQDHANLELIISDNASTDNTQAICERYAAKDPRVRYSRNAVNQGPTHNFHRVLHLATGPYFMWAADDDYWAPAFVSSLLAELERHPDSGVAMTAFDNVWEDGEPGEVVRFGAELGKSPNEMTRLEQFKHAQYRFPFYMYLYGLYRRPFLLSLLEQPFLEVQGADVIFISEMALATKFRFVDRVLHTRTLHRKHAMDRYPDDPSAKAVREQGWTKESEVPLLLSRIAQSKLIPWRLKLAARLWLKARNLDLRKFPGGGVVHRAYRAVGRLLG